MKTYKKALLIGIIMIPAATCCMNWRIKREMQLKLSVELMLFRGWVNQRNLPEALWVKTKIDTIKDPLDYTKSLQKYHDLHNRGLLEQEIQMIKEHKLTALATKPSPLKVKHPSL